MSSSTTPQGIDRTVFLIFGGLLLILFIVVSAAGIRGVERDAERTARKVDLPGNLPEPEFGL